MGETQSVLESSHVRLTGGTNQRQQYFHNLAKNSPRLKFSLQIPHKCGVQNTLSLSQKSRIRETKNLSTDADSRTDTILERLRDLSLKQKKYGEGGIYFL